MVEIGRLSQPGGGNSRGHRGNRCSLVWAGTRNRLLHHGNSCHILSRGWNAQNTRTLEKSVANSFCHNHPATNSGAVAGVSTTPQDRNMGSQNGHGDTHGSRIHLSISLDDSVNWDRESLVPPSFQDKCAVVALPPAVDTPITRLLVWSCPHDAYAPWALNSSHMLSSYTSVLRQPICHSSPSNS